jgi:hypothetical protein
LKRHENNRDETGAFPMPRVRQYATAAERQAAYRARTYWQQPPRQKFLAGIAQGLHYEMTEALKQGTCPLPAELLGEDVGQTLRNLRDYIHYGSLEAAHKAREDQRLA